MNRNTIKNTDVAWGSFVFISRRSLSYYKFIDAACRQLDLGSITCKDKYDIYNTRGKYYVVARDESVVKRRFLYERKSAKSAISPIFHTFAPF